VVSRRLRQKKKKKAEEVATLKAEKKTLDAQIEKDDACIEKNKGKTGDAIEICDPVRLSTDKRGEVEKEIGVKKAAIETGEKEFATLEKVASDKQTEVNDLKANLESYDRAAIALRLGKSTAFANAEIYGSDEIKDPECCDQDMRHVATAVHNIVEDFYKQSYIDEVCTTLFTSTADGEIDNRAFSEFSQRFEYKSVVKDLDPVPGKTSLFEICQVHIAHEADAREKIAAGRLNIAEKEIEIAKIKSFAAGEEIKRAASLSAQARKDKNAATAKITQVRNSKKNASENLKTILTTLENSREALVLLKASIPDYTTGAVDLSTLINSVCTPSAAEWLKKPFAPLFSNEKERSAQCRKLRDAEQNGTKEEQRDALENAFGKVMGAIEQIDVVIQKIKVDSMNFDDDGGKE